MKYKVGQKIRVLKSGVDCAGVSKGDVFVIDEINSYGIYTRGGLRWSLPFYSIEPIEESTKPPFYVDCPTEDIWNKVLEKMKEMGGIKFDYQENFSNGYTILDMDDGDIFSWKEEEKISVGDSKHIPYQEFLGEESPKKEHTCTGSTETYHAYTGGKITNLFHSVMEELNTIPARIKKLLSPTLKAFYKLGWVNEELEPSSEGKKALTDFLWDKYQDELGKVAEKEVAKRVKALKKAKKDIDED